MRALLIGNYGVGNFGDEALKEYFVAAFPEVEWTVVSATPGKGIVPRLPFGFRSLFAPWWKTISAIRRSDVVIFGGGTLFTDIESPKACALWEWHAFWARRCGKPYVLAFQGVGPFRTKKGEHRAWRAVRYAAHVSVRDSASKKRVDAWRPDAVEAFDPAILYFSDFMGTVRHGGKTLIVIPRENATDTFIAKAKRMAADKNRFTGVRVLSFKPDDPRERSICTRFEDAHVVAVHSVADLERALTDVSFILTQRYHGAIAALATRTPFEAVPQKEGDKLASATPRLLRDDCMRLAKEGESALRGFLAGIR